MAVTIEERMAEIARRRISVAEVVLSELKCAEYAFHPDTKYLLCFESSLTPQQVSAVRSLFGANGRNVFMICGGEEPKVFELKDELIRFPKQRMFLVNQDEEPKC